MTCHAPLPSNGTVFSRATTDSFSLPYAMLLLLCASSSPVWSLWLPRYFWPLKGFDLFWIWCRLFLTMSFACPDLCLSTIYNWTPPAPTCAYLTTLLLTSLVPWIGIFYSLIYQPLLTRDHSLTLTVINPGGPHHPRYDSCQLSTLSACLSVKICTACSRESSKIYQTHQNNRL